MWKSDLPVEITVILFVFVEFVFILFIAKKRFDYTLKGPFSKMNYKKTDFFQYLLKYIRKFEGTNLSTWLFQNNQLFIPLLNKVKITES